MDQSVCYLWPRQEVFHLVLPVFNQCGVNLTNEVVLCVSRELFRVRTSEHEVSYESWLIVAKDHLKWPDNGIKLFWDMLCAAIHQVGGVLCNDSYEGSIDAVAVEYLCLFIVLHMQDSANKVGSPAASNTYDAVWPGGIDSETLSPRSPSPSGSSSPSPRSPPHRPPSSSLSTISPSPGSPSSLSQACMRPSSPKRQMYPIQRQHRSAPYILELIRSRLPLLVRSISSELEAVGSDNRIIARRAIDRLGLIIGGGPSQTTQESLLSNLHPIWAAGPDGEVSHALSLSLSQEMRVSSSLTLIADGESGSALAETVLEWLDTHLSLNDHVYPTSDSMVVISSKTGAVGAGSGSSSQGISAFPSFPVAPYASGLQGMDMGIMSSRSTIMIVSRPTIVSGVNASTYMHVSTISSVPGSDGTIGAMGKPLLAHCPGALPHLLVQSCYHAFIYELAAHSSALIVGCTDSTLIIGAISGSVVVSACERVHITVACRNLVIRNCLDCTFNLATLGPTTIAGDSRGLVFGPLNVSYRSLHEHVEAAALNDLVRAPRSAFSTAMTSASASDDDSCLEFWSIMYDVNTCLDKPTIQGSPSGYAIDAAEARCSMPRPPESIALIKAPRDFSFISVPLIEQHLDTSDSVASTLVPNRYMSSFISRRETSASMRRQLDTQIEKETKEISSARKGLSDTVSDVVSDKFLDWLVTSGNAQSVLDLIRMDTERKS